MALVEGTNSGFVTASPSVDPAATDVALSTNCWGSKHTSPAGNQTVKELGSYIDNATAAANMEVGIYSHDAANNRPDSLLVSVSFAKGTTAGWKSDTCNYDLTASTVYWIVTQVDASAGCNGNYGSLAGSRASAKYSQATLPASWGVSDSDNDNLAITNYAKYEATGAATYALTVTAGAGGTASDETGTSPYLENAVVDILATPNANYSFNNWTTNDGGSFDNANAADTNYNMPANIAEITANFTEDTFALTVTAGTGGTASDETGTSPYVTDAVVDILATPNEGYSFNNWTTSDGGTFDSSTTADTNYNMPSNIAEITANFTADAPAQTTQGGGSISHEFKRFPELTNNQIQKYPWDSPHKQILEGFMARVIKVTDGDTIKVRCDFRDFDFPVRFANIEAPELGEEGGLESKTWLSEKILGEEVYILVNPNNRIGKWGRLIGEIFHMGMSINQMSVNEGKSLGAWVK